jgi:autotransporter-associated beta strand protein
MQRTRNSFRDRRKPRGIWNGPAFILAVVALFSFPELSASPGIIRNPTSADTIWRDTAGRELINFCGNILQVGDTFYWYGWDKYAKTVKVYSSKTLGSDTWKREAILINDGKYHGRPDVIYNATTGTYVMIVKFSSSIGRDGLQYMTSSSPTGPFTTQLLEHKVINDGDGVNMGDKGVYQDDDPARTAYLLATTDDGGNVNGTTKIVRLKSSYIGQEAVIQSWTVTTGRREALAMVKRNGIYYLTSSATSGWDSSLTRYKTAASIAGTWSALANVRTVPSSTDSFNTQHDFVLTIVGTVTTSYMYAGDRWSQDTGIGFGRNAWYPLTFDSQGVPWIHGDDLWSIDPVTGRVVLEPGRLLTWHGGVSADWDTSTANWNFGNDVYLEYGEGGADFVSFNDGGVDPRSLHTNINLIASLRPGSVVVSNSVHDFALAGAGKLTGGMSLGKTGSAALMLATANDFSGGSFLTNGAVRLGHSQALGTGPVVLWGAALSSDGATARTLTNAVSLQTDAPLCLGDDLYSGSLEFSGPMDFGGGTNRNLTVNAGVTMSGQLLNGGIGSKNGLGTLTLTGTNAHTGTTVVAAGALMLGSGNTAPGRVVVADGATLGFLQTAASEPVRVAAATIGSETGGAVNVAFFGQTSSSTEPCGYVTNLTLAGTIPVNVQLANPASGTVPLVGYETLHGDGSVIAGVLPPGVTGVVTNDLSAKTLKLIITSVPPALSTAVFHDTFEPDGTIAASRNDDSGAGFGLDVQWRPRIGSQSGAYSVVNDAVFGNALKFRQTANNLWIIAQFDNDAADGITFGGSSIPASLGPNVNDALELSLRIRVGTALGTNNGRTFYCGLLNVPGGPLSADPGSDNTWIDPATGYYFAINEVTPALVVTAKQVGHPTTTPYQGVSKTNLTSGIAGITRAFGTDTGAHTILMRFTRNQSAVQVDTFWDDTLVSAATDDGTAGGVGPFTEFNTLGMLYGTGNMDYIVDDVKLESIRAANVIAPSLSALWAADGNFILNATGGPAGRQFHLLSSTNVALPLADWTAATTNLFDDNGAFRLTNAINPAVRQQFYWLRVP